MSSAKEYEIIQHSDMKHLEVFLVEMTSRSPHSHDDLEIGMLLEGSLTLHLERETFLLQKGEIYLINRHQVHSFARTTSENLILAFQIHTEFYKNINYALEFLHFESNIIHSGRLHGIILESLRECAVCYFSSTPYHDLKCASIMLDVLFRLVQSTHCNVRTEKEFSSACRNAMRLNRMISFINEHYTGKISLRDIADLENISQYHASHFIKNALGVSFQEYLNQIRFAHALQLLQTTDLHILDICMETGFSSSRYLNQMFRKNFGCCAKEYLKAEKKPALPGASLPTGNIQKRYSIEQAQKYWIRQQSMS